MCYANDLHSLNPAASFRLQTWCNTFNLQMQSSLPEHHTLVFSWKEACSWTDLVFWFRFVSFWAQVFLSLQHHTSFDSIISIAIHGKETQFSAEAFILGSVFRSHFNPLLLTRNKSDAFPQCKVGSSHLQDRRRVLNKMPHAGHFFFQREGPMEAWQCVTVKIEASPTGHECTSVWAWQWHVV